MQPELKKTQAMGELVGKTLGVKGPKDLDIFIHGLVTGYNKNNSHGIADCFTLSIMLMGKLYAIVQREHVSNKETYKEMERDVSFALQMSFVNSLRLLEKEKAVTIPAWLEKELQATEKRAASNG